MRTYLKKKIFKSIRKYHKVDTGFVLEIFLIEKLFNLKYLIYSKNSEKLLNLNLYTGKDFSKLREIYS